MQQDSTDKILQQIESKQLPDLSQMDKHWEDMRKTLALGVIGEPFVSATAKWMIAAALICAIALFGWQKGWFSSGDNKDAKTQDFVKVKSQPIPQNSDSVLSPNILPQTNFQLNFPSIKFPIVTWAVPHARIDSGSSKKFLSTYTVDPFDKDISPTKPLNEYANNVSSEKRSEAMNAQLMQQFWNQVEKKPQQFVIDNQYDTQVQGAEGTAIKIPANAFSNAGDGKITIELTEFYDYGEMIANKLTTTSYQRQLISDGMLRIRATQNGKEIQMTGLKPMDVYMPRRDLSNNMQLFAGEWKNFIGNPKLINWIPMGQQQSFRYYLGDGSASPVLHPYAIHKRWFTKKKGVKYSLENDNVTGISAATAKKLIEDSYTDEITAKVRKGQPRFLGLFPRRSLREYWEYNYQLPPKNQRFYAKGGYQYDTAELRTADSIQGRYNFSVTTTGWINCDRFSDDRAPRVEFAVSGNKEEKIYCSYLVFKNIKSVLPGYASDNKCIFHDIPEGKEVTLVTIGIRNGKTVCSMRDMKTGSGDITGMRFEETNPEDFKQKLLTLKL